MIISYIIFIPLLIVSLWLFFKFSPRQIRPDRVRFYNFSTLVLAVILCIAFSLKIRAAMINGSDAGWWPVLAFIFSLIISACTILISGVARNFIIFK